ncbi:DUF11 domain-containing protein [Xylophilus rhododendri]|uniref:DUF11 domain-containing protein n=1 Tax=Xylophilus rhododendri TaxID=2697032 RepID=A0A857J108_9BURK|nr:DUF11 domain-containing protein [Xylophilus rhododendri]QHI97277.1 DUF11 domain-containing protein [Xylophilus rhododendri]
MHKLFNDLLPALRRPWMALILAGSLFGPALAGAAVGPDLARPQGQGWAGTDTGGLTEKANNLCPAGQVLIGLNFWNVAMRAVLYDGTGIQGICATIADSLAIREAGTTGAALASGVGYGATSRMVCPAGQVLSGWSVMQPMTDRQSVSGVGLFCSTLGRSGTSVTVSSPFNTQLVAGVSAGGRRPLALCPAGTAAARFDARTGSALQQLQLVCYALLDQKPDLRLAVLPPSPPMVVGTQSTVTATVTNTGNADAAGAVIKLQTNAALKLQGKVGSGWSCTVQSDTVASCALSGTIAAGGGTITVQLQFRPGPEVGGTTVTSEYSIGADGGEGPAPAGCSDASQCVRSANAVEAGVLLGITTSSPVPALAVGQESRYTVTLRNQGSAAASAAQVKARVPAGLDYVAGTGDGWTCVPDSDLVSCSFGGSIAAGSSSALTLGLRPTPGAAGNTVSLATSVGKTGAGAPSPGACSDPAECSTSADGGTQVATGVVLGIALSRPVPDLAVGVDSTYTVTVTNTGTGPAAAAQVKLQLPAGLDHVSTTGGGWNCSLGAGSLVTCNATGTLPPAAVGTFGLVVRPTSAAVGTDPGVTGSIGKEGGPAPAPGTCSDPAECTASPGGLGPVGSGVSLGISISAPVPRLTVGIDSTYTVTVTNQGSGAATAAQVKLQLPAGLDHVSTTGGGWNCSLGAGSLVTCNATGTLPPAGVGTFGLVVRPTSATVGTDPGVTGSIGKEGGPAPAPGTCSDPAECTASPGGLGPVGSGVSLSMSISAPVPRLTVGIDSTYTVTVTNQGSGPATAAQVKLQLLAGLDHVSTTGGGWNCSLGAGSLVTCNATGTLPPAAVGTFGLVVRPTSAAVGTDPGVTGSIGKEGGPAPAPGTCSDPAECTASPGGLGPVGSGVSLGISISAPVPRLTVGIDSTYTVTVTNQGSGAATAAQVKLQLPAGLDHVSTTGGGWNCSLGAGSLVTCNATGTLPPAAVGTFGLVVRPTSAAVGTDPGVTGSIGKEGGPAPAPGTCSDPAECTASPGGLGPVGSGVSLGISISAPVPRLTVGIDSTYTVTVTNQGSGPATAAQVKLQLPSGLDQASTAGGGWNCSPGAAGLVTCNSTGTLAPASSSTFALIVRPGPAATGTAPLVAASIGKEGGPAPTPGSCADPAECTSSPGGGGTVDGGVTLGISMSSPTPALEEGVDSTYTVTVIHKGTGPAPKAQVKLQLPAGLEQVSTTGSGWACSPGAAGSLVTCDATVALLPGSSSILVLAVRPAPDTAGKVLVPAGSVGRDGGPAPAPGTSCTDAEACTAGPADPRPVASGVVLTIAVSGPAPALTVNLDSTLVVTLTNAGNAPARRAQLKVQLPAWLDYRSLSGPGWNCSAAAGLLGCDYHGAIAVGDSNRVALTVRPASQAAGQQPSIAVAVGQTGDTAPTPGSACTESAQCWTGPTDPAPVGSGIGLTVKVSALTPGLEVGKESQFAVTVANNGSASANAAQVKVQLPPGLNFNGSDGTGWKAAIDANQLVSGDFSGSIAPGEASTVVLKVQPAATLAGQTARIVLAIGKDGAEAPHPGGCSEPGHCATVPGSEDIVGRGIALTLATAPPAPALAVGTDSVYVLRIRNRGSAPSPTAQVKTQLPQGMDFGAGPPGEGWQCASDASQRVTCDFAGADIPPGGEPRLLSLQVRPSPALAGASVGTVSSIGKDGGPAPEPDAMCSDPDSCSIVPASVVGGGGGLAITKQANKKQAEIGDVVRYTVGVAYLGGGTARTVTVDDRLPAGFRYIPGTLALRRGNAPALPVADPAGAPGPRLTLAAGDIEAGGRVELSYRVRIGIGAQRGTGSNTARAQSANGMASATARAVVQVSGGVFSTDACILGKVFTDCDGNGLQNGQEIGIPQARVYLEDGTNIGTDSNGNFSICGMRPTTHVMRVDPASLPEGARLLPSSSRNAGDPDSLFVDLKNGELHRADFAVQACTPAQQQQIRERAQALEKAEQAPGQRPDFGLRFNSDRSLRAPPGR